MDGFSWKRLLIKFGVLALLYFVLFLIIHLTDAVPYLEASFTGDYETTDSNAQTLLSFLRILFYLIIPAIITLFEILIIRYKFSLYLRRLIETLNIFYVSLYLFKVVFFFTAMDKKYGITVLEGVDLAVFITTLVLNVICYKKPNFLIFQQKKSEKENPEN